MPVGYLVSALLAATAAALALSPRRIGGPRLTAAFVVETGANELPFALFYLVVASTALTAAQGELDSPVGWAGLVVATVAVAVLVVVVRRALAARPVLADAMTASLGAGAERGSIRCLPWGRVLLAPLPIRSRGIRRVRDVAYGPAGRHNRLDVYFRSTGPVDGPVFVYFHGGGFYAGAKSREARLIIDRLVGHGWLCVSANYRLGREAVFPNAVVDAKRVLAWVRQHAADYGADPRPLLVAGGSAGANLAAMSALTADDASYQPGFEGADTSVSAAICLYGYYGASPGGEAAPSSPGEHVRPDAPPFLVVHGSRDPMVDPAQAREFADRLRATSRAPVVHAELPGGQHAFDRFASIRCAVVAAAIEEFGTWVRARLRLGP